MSWRSWMRHAIKTVPTLVGVDPKHAQQLTNSLLPTQSAGAQKRSDEAGAQVIGDQNNRATLMDQENQSEKSYFQMPDYLKDKYTNAAQKAGTFASTPEFQAGLTSDVNAGLRGGRLESESRINAIRKQLGQEGDFDPNNLSNPNNVPFSPTNAPVSAPNAAPSQAPTAPASPVPPASASPAASNQMQPAFTLNGLVSGQSGQGQKKPLSFNGRQSLSASGRTNAIGRKFGGI